MPTIRRCCIVGCMSNSRLNPNLQFFQFPRPDNPFYKLWTQACQASLSRILPFKKPVLCAVHFHPHCIGGRRLTSSAIPTLKLEVPTNLKAVEQQAMVEEIERSRKCAFINAVVYEWLVRANLNPQLRGSITHGMIKEKAETAKQIIGCDTFMADNRWLNRFRESHLAGFAQKLAANQLKPMGPSLWIPDIVQDLQHLFPPTSAERIENFENVPEQYISYMKQYGEYEEDDDSEQDQAPPSNGYSEQDNEYPDSKISPQTYYQQQQQTVHNYYQQHPPPPHQPPQHQAPQHQPQQHQLPQHQPPPHHHQQLPPPHPVNGYNPYVHHPGYNAYHDYYNDRHQQPLHYPSPFNGHHPGMHPHAALPGPQQQPPLRPLSHTPPQQTPMQVIRPMSHSPMSQSPMCHSPPQHEQQSPAHVRPMSHSPPQLQAQQQAVHGSPLSPVSQSVIQNGADPLQIERTASVSPNKRRYSQENEDNDVDKTSSKRSSPAQNGLKSHTPSPTAELREPTETNNNDSFKIKLPLLNGSSSLRRSASPTPSTQSNNTRDSNSRSSSPKSETVKAAAKIVNGRKSCSPAPSSMDTSAKALETYAQALEYLKPLEDFALFKENFRAIGLLSQLENILQKGNRIVMGKTTTAAK